MPILLQERYLEKFTVQLGDFESVTKSIQLISVAHAEICALFNGIIDRYAHTETRLSATADIVRNTDFEFEIVNLDEKFYCKSLKHRNIKCKYNKKRRLRLLQQLPAEREIYRTY